MIDVSRCMSTQHPDNVSTPFFSDSDILAGESEVKEAFYVFSQLGCREQMWDSEGKEVDNQVVEKLFSKYTDFFHSNILGKDFFLTFRVPNPSVQKEQGKILLETLHSIPRAFDVARLINGDIPPIFEVILPMTTSHLELERVRLYYEKVLAGQGEVRVGDKKVSEWVGGFEPKRINVIPLLEDYSSFINSSKILLHYLKGKRMEYQRVFLARSDPALNYGSLSAVLLAKIALQELHAVQERTSVDILPILGVGSAPFRGNFRPDNIANCGKEYPSVQTYTIQSAFKYDYPPMEVIKAIEHINSTKRGTPLSIDHKVAKKYIEKIKTQYQKEVGALAGLINRTSAFIPQKRARKLHIGLYGYARSLKGIRLPRTIGFCAALYSIGLPPELLGLGALSEQEFDELHDHYVKLDEDLADAVSFLNRKNLHYLPKMVSRMVERVLSWLDYEEDPEYSELTDRIFLNIRRNHTVTLNEDIKSAAWMRRFLG